MNARFLTTFQAVAETGSFSAAARSLGLSSTSVSEQIAVLETQLKTKLVMRNGRTIALTEAGRAILPACQDVLNAVDELFQAAQLEEPRGVLRVGAVATAMVSVLPPALRVMAHDYPQMELKVYPGSSAYLFERLEKGELDCMITGLPIFSLPKSMVWHSIRIEPLVLVQPGDAPEGPIEETLSRMPFIRMDRNSWMGTIINRFLEFKNIRPREILEMDAPEVIVTLVSQGLGVSLLPDWGFSVPADRQVRRIPIPEPAYYRELGLIGLQSRKKMIGRFASVLVDGNLSDHQPRTIGTGR